VSELPDPKHTAVSIITQPSVTLKTLKDAHAAGITYVWMQPGTDNEDVIAYANEVGFKFVSGGPCILQIGDSLLQQGSRL
jgi:predicted CoA-binding protein